MYYYLRRMDEDLQDELKPKLKNGINLDKVSLVEASLSSVPRVAVIHASQRHNADLKQKIQILNLDLIIFLSQGAGKPKAASNKLKEEFPDIPIIWECGTEYLIEYFDKFEQYIRENSVGDWQLPGWSASDLNQLAALGILCQGYLAIHAAGEVGKILDGINRLPEPIFSSIAHNLKRKKEQVYQASWWLNVFGLWDEKTQTVVSEQWTDFERSLAEEWRAVASEPFPEAVIQLLEAMHNCSAGLQQPERVAKAYRAIAAVLETSRGD